VQKKTRVTLMSSTLGSDKKEGRKERGKELIKGGGGGFHEGKG